MFFADNSVQASRRGILQSLVEVFFLIDQNLQQELKDSNHNMEIFDIYLQNVSNEVMKE